MSIIRHSSGILANSQGILKVGGGGGGNLPSWWGDTVFYAPMDSDWSNEGSVGATGSSDGPTITAGDFKYGDGAGTHDGTVDQEVTFADDPDFSIGANEDFTIAGWVKAPSQGIKRFVSLTPTTYVGVTNATFDWDINNYQFGIGTFTFNTWMHFALVRDGTTARMFVNGIQVYNYSAAPIGNAIDPASIVLFGEGATGARLNGLLDDVMIVIGTKVWVANFTPPTGPHNDAGSYSS